MADVALDKLSATSPAHEQGKVMHASSKDNQEAKQDGAETGTESLVVVAAASPCREAIAQEVVVSLAFGALEDVGHDGEALVAGGDLLDVCVDFLLGGSLAHFDAGRCALLLVRLLVLVDEALTGLVGMESCRLLAVGLVQLVLRRAGLDAEEVVEGDVATLGSGDLVADAEDLVVWRRVSARPQL